MDVYHSFLHLPDINHRTAVTIGAYDGLHLGHISIIRQTVEYARKQGIKSVVISFQTPPRMVLAPDTTKGTLICPEHKLEILKQQGVDILLLINLTPAIRHTTAEEFIKDYLFALNPEKIFAGPTLHFGKDRKGTAAMLEDFGNKAGFSVCKTSKVTDEDGHLISSSLIRKTIHIGDFKKAASLLGRPYRLCGTVIKGLGYAGDELNLPTANLDPGLQVVPPSGVYAVRAILDNGKTYPGASNISRGKNPKIEVHVFGINEDLYSKRIGVVFEEKIRDEITFSSQEHEKQVIAQDIKSIQQVLGI